ncbi:permease [Halobacteriales archaeon QS_1_68_17]|nr:MAG: permease [Halobacteriales archaeon QS_1_68_17]
MAPQTTVFSRLSNLYRQYIGEPDREVDIPAGFGLFFGGIALGALGLVLFLWSATAPEGSAAFWQRREVAIALAMVGLPAFVTSVVVLLPVDRRALYAGIAGSAVCLVAVGLFVAAYPRQWNVSGTDYSTVGIGVYAVGLAVLGGATGAALVAHHLSRTPAPAGERSVEGAGAAGSTPDASGGGETVTDEQVRRDIDEAMADADLTWGGVEKTEGKRLKVETPDEDIDISGLDADAANTKRSESVDDAVSGLQKLRGGQREEGTGEGTDEQTAALQELRERKQQEEPEDESVSDRLKDLLGL